MNETKQALAHFISRNWKYRIIESIDSLQASLLACPGFPKKWECKHSLFFGGKTPIQTL